MTEKQEKLLTLYREIDEICKRNHIDYFMAGGTLLGAVRHRGFIPWDDDMDVYMTRDNWHRFLEVCKTQLPENRVIECQELNRGYYNMFGRYIDTTSTAIHSAQMFFEDTAGFVVDILVLDPIPDSDEEYEKYLCDLMLYSDLINATVVYSYRWQINRRRYPYYRMLMRLYGKDKVLSKLEKRMFSYPEKDCNRYAMRWGGAPFIFPKWWFEGVKWADFEDIKCEIPAETGAYLTWHYGDEWMFIPPHAEHESHDAIYSMKHPYQPVRAEMMKMMNKKKHQKMYLKRKYRIVKTMDTFQNYNNAKRELKAQGVRIDLQQRLATQKQQVEQMYAEQNFAGLFEIFADYFSNQLCADFIGREDFVNIYRFHHPILIEIPQDMFVIAVLTLMNMEKISKAMRLMDVYEKKTGNIPDTLQQVRQDILEFRQGVIEYERGHRDLSFEIAVRLSEKYPCCISYLKFAIRLLCEFNEKGQYTEKIEKLIQKGLSIVPGSGDFLKYSADMRFSRNPRAALEKYVYAYTMTTNGLTQLEIKDILAEHVDELVKAVAYRGQTDLERALNFCDICSYILKANEKLFEQKCKLVTALIGDSWLEFSSYNRRLSRYVRRHNEKNPLLMPIYVDFLTQYTGNRAAAQLFAAEKTKKDHLEAQQDIERLKQSAKTADSHTKAWCYKLIADNYIKLGDEMKAYDHACRAYQMSDDPFFRFVMVRGFCRDLSECCKKACFAEKRTKQNGGRDYQGVEQEKVVLQQWSCKYPHISDAVKFYTDLGVLKPEDTGSILRFNLLDLEEEYSEWTIQAVKMFTRICFGACQGIYVVGGERVRSDGFIKLGDDDEEEEEEDLLEIVNRLDEEFAEIIDKDDEEEEEDEEESFDESEEDKIEERTKAGDTQNVQPTAQE